MTEKLIFELGSPGRQGVLFPANDVPEIPPHELLPRDLIREQEVPLPEVSEGDAVRHFVRLSRMNFGVDVGFYPLGSCTMKYNPKVAEDAAGLSGFANIHPYQPDEISQGALQLMYETQQDLAEITGMDAFTLQPAAGAQGELTGMLIIKAYLESKGETGRNKVIVPDSAHGTNPATAALCGFKVVEVKSDQRGGVDLAALKQLLGPDVAALMLTNPSTLGLFEDNITEIAALVHQAGGLLYYDGANLNAIMGYARPGDMGFDVVHLNLHKTFGTPHGGGGPGSGPVGVKAELAPFLPKPVIIQREGNYLPDYHRPQSIGRVKAFFANFSVIVKAYTYLRSLGGKGLKEVSEHAVLNANYLMKQLSDHFRVPYQRTCMHEFVVSPPEDMKEQGIKTLDIAKRLLDYGYHPPTVYFPLIVEEALMFEPTETESKETLDEFAHNLIKVLAEARENPDKLRNAPYTTPIRRLDEVMAARKPLVGWFPE
ncbi:glycine dehydrogenase (decarboxylating) beta subunit [Desulforamulus reducens MI-1]|uniref:Probable glycine dehydrogenase (decarboxylating) subunit 2 n=1 Tax=Desulforamulus reducens (strain ATCC BAA-1160 / DSM 100696 / MI-1) TaxID=349161 RepID=GCSPB_DESRM|nr:aminomethyl-transferring glycine dehydrogenase subunit GcvPB [Desulforamulus reducens]A4J2F9.1 RecName: Full=Probable glycine dehydrogenase (decarboxylating) subunit 2; AltName: Full=Glycine cleavage system P-protein subunit 2; AltName: Full=Glycine decarboxylase subunit 2; AltName: Full=Glycine dehydrogenase (aminomethyl-transferring) subunit 2 [Desulforamulus reducens MI-1]ABO49262.1 glycine dehydrogenase (decarboxylating) beta subunit [Desulforamulus reducens MI-1]